MGAADSVGACLQRSGFIAVECPLTGGQFGTLTGLFLLPGVLIAIPSGALTRAVADKNLLLAGALAMAVGAFVMGSATSTSELYAGRLITGVDGTIFNVVLTKMVTDWFVDKEIVLALAAMLTAWPIGNALGRLMHGQVAQTHGWNWVMHCTDANKFATAKLTVGIGTPLSSSLRARWTARPGEQSLRLGPH